jgi:hypothetical protein
MTQIRISSSIILYPIIFLCLFQFLVILFSSTILPFIPSLIISVGIGFFLSIYFVAEFQEKIDLTLRELIILLVVSMIVTFVFLLRMNWGVIDFICTTGLLGLVSRVAGGEFPLTYMSFPDIVMNYHQGTILLMSVVTAATKLPVAMAIKATLSGLFFLLNVSISLWLLQERSRLYFLPSLLFILIGSADSVFYRLISDTVFTPIRIIEWGSSNSWPLTFLLIIAFLFIAKKYDNSKKHLLIVCLITLSLSTINALAFQLLLISFAILFALYLGYSWRKSKPIPIRQVNLTLLALLALITIPKHIPGALLTGGLFSQPQIELGFLALPFMSYAEGIGRYVLLASVLPPLTLLAVFLSRPKIARQHALLYVLLFVSFLFPLLFVFKNVVEWEMLHKCALIAIFTSTVVVSLLLSTKTKLRWVLLVIVTTSVLMSILDTRYFLLEKISLDFSSFNHPPTDISDVVEFLSKHNTTLTPYNNDQGVYCYDDEEYSSIAQWSGNNLKDAYKINFLLNEQFEAEYLEKASWKNFEAKTMSAKKDLDNGETLIVRNSLLDSKSQALLEEVIRGEKKEFLNYTLYRTRPW